MRRTLTYCHTRSNGTKFVGSVVIAFLHFALRPKGFDDAHTSQSFLQLRHRFAPFDLSIHTRLFEFAPNASHAPTHQWQHQDGEKRELPGDVKQTAKIDNQENRIFHQHLQTTHNGVFDFSHVTTHSRNDVAFALIAEKGKWEHRDFLVDEGANVSHNASAHRHHRGHRSKIRSCFQARGHHQKQTDEEQSRACPILCHQLRSVVVGIVNENIGKRHSLFAPIDEGINLMLGVEKQFEHRDERSKRKDIEHCTQHVEEE